MIAVGGENLIDLVAGDGTADGEANNPHYIPHAGGSPFNVAMAAGRQGAKAAYLTPISDDALGDLLAGRLEDSGVVLAGPRSPKPSSLAVVTLMDGIPTYAFYREGTAERQVSTASIAQTMPDDARIFHVGSAALIDGPDAEAWEEVFMEAADKGLVTSIDPNIRPSLIEDATAHRTRIRRMMGAADIFKASDEDMAWLYPDIDEKDYLRASLGAALGDAKSAGAVIITAGERSAKAVCGGNEFSVPVHKAGPVADTVGAGDTFMASILVWCLDNGGPAASKARDAIRTAIASPGFEDALMRGAVAAGINCTRHGCEPPSAAEIDAALEKGVKNAV